MTKRLLVLLMLVGCGGSIQEEQVQGCTRPDPKNAKVCQSWPTEILDNPDGTSNCVGITVPPEGCIAWNGVANDGFCVPKCP